MRTTTFSRYNIRLGYYAYFSFGVFVYAVMVDAAFATERYAALARAALRLSYQEATVDAGAQQVFGSVT